MRKRRRYRRRRFTHHTWAWLIVLLLAAGVWIDRYGIPLPTTDQVTIYTPGQGSGSRIIGPSSSTSSVVPDVIDGDTVRVRGETFRLVGFNTPEIGDRARCAYERDLAQRATARLRELVDNARKVELEPVRCSCPPGTEGTSQCNYGRSCGRLRVDGRDIGSILMSEGLARAFVCGPTRCPRIKPWC